MSSGWMIRNCPDCKLQPVFNYTRRGWELKCLGCGRRIWGQSSRYEAVTNWNAQMECAAKMKGHEND